MSREGSPKDIERANPSSVAVKDSASKADETAKNG